METGKEYPVYTFTAKNNIVDGRYFVAANDENCAKEYINKINSTVPFIGLDVESCTEFKNLKYDCPYWNNKVDAICIINALHYKY